MYAIDITFGLFIVLFTILLLRWIRKPSLQISGVRSQRMCPSCGLITSRLISHCQECGKTFTTVE
jgi:hypothetical protein